GVVAEGDGAGVGGGVGGGVEVVGGGPRPRGRGGPAVPAVGVVLEVGQVGAVALQHLHRLERRGVVARRPQVVAVQVQWVGQPQVVDDAGQRRDDQGGRDLV